MNKRPFGSRVTHHVTDVVAKWLDRHVPLMAGELSTLDRLDNAGKAAEQGARVMASR